MFLFQAAVTELVRVVTQCGHLVGDTIVHGSATSHMVPVEQADGELYVMEMVSPMLIWAWGRRGHDWYVVEEQSSCYMFSKSNH